MKANNPYMVLRSPRSSSSAWQPLRNSSSVISPSKSPSSWLNSISARSDASLWRKRDIAHRLVITLHLSPLCVPPQSRGSQSPRPSPSRWSRPTCPCQRVFDLGKPLFIRASSESNRYLVKEAKGHAQLLLHTAWQAGIHRQDKLGEINRSVPVFVVVSED